MHEDVSEKALAGGEVLGAQGETGVGPIPSLKWEEIDGMVSEGQLLLVIEGDVFDVSQIINVHPGGRMAIKKWIGYDATRAFNGEEYMHSKRAREWLSDFIVGRLPDSEKTLRLGNYPKIVAKA